MSATGIGKSSYLPGAAYMTPLPLTRPLVALLPFLAVPQVVLEPSVGGGAWLRAVLEREGRDRVFHRYLAVDSDPAASGLALVLEEGGEAVVADFLDPALRLSRRPTVVLGNPPFGEVLPEQDCEQCGGHGRRLVRGVERPCGRCRTTGRIVPKPRPVVMRHVERALGLVARGGHVALLLRLSMLAGQERLAFWRQHPARHVWVIADRPDFTGEGGDSADYALFWWEVGYAGPTTIEPVYTASRARAPR